MSRRLEDDAALAVDLVRAAGRLSLRMQRDGVEARLKTSPSDLVTAADQAAEELVVKRLARERPGDGLLGEEGASDEGSTGRTWVIDPLDGTYNFVHGLTWWCSALALRDRDQVLLGAVYHPHDDQWWVGGRDLPTVHNGTTVDPIEDRPLESCSLTTYLHPGWLATPDVVEPFNAVASRTKVMRMAGSGSMDLAAVAQGRVDLWCQHSVPTWDWMPGQALVEGAGGKVTHVEARGLVWSLAGPASAVEEAVALLRST